MFIKNRNCGAPLLGLAKYILYILSAYKVNCLHDIFQSALKINY